VYEEVRDRGYRHVGQASLVDHFFRLTLVLVSCSAAVTTLESVRVFGEGWSPQRTAGSPFSLTGDGDKFFFDEKNPENTAWDKMIAVNINAVIYGTRGLILTRPNLLVS